MSDVLGQQLEKLHSELKDLRPQIQARLLFLSKALTETFNLAGMDIAARVRCNLDRWPDWRKQPAPEGIITIEILNDAQEVDAEFEVIVEKKYAYLRPRLRGDICKNHYIKISYCRALARVAEHLAHIEEIAADPALAELLEHQFKTEQDIKKLEELTLKEEEHQHRRYIREVLSAYNNRLKFKKPIEVYDKEGLRIKNIEAVQSIIFEHEFYAARAVRSNKEIASIQLAWGELSRLCQLQEAQK